MTKQWSPVLKFTFLFLSAYIFLYANSIQFITSFILDPIWKKIVPLFAKLTGASKEVKYALSGSGDTTFDYYLILLFAVLAILFAIIVFIANRKRTNYNSALKWVMVFIRYYLFSQMLMYGLAKLFYLQFQPPSFIRLDSTFGEASPMGLLWTFMGYSMAYTMFTGFLELVAGLFLLSRKTVKLGALLTFGVMSNVMMLNYCYDVPVKLLSTHIVVMSLLLVLFYSKDLITFFLKNEMVSPIKLTDVVPEKWMKFKFYTKWILLTAFIGYNLYGTIESYKQYGMGAEKIPLQGAYEVEQFDAFSEGIPKTEVNDSTQWKALYNLKYGNAKVLFENDKHKWHQFETDTIENHITFKTRKDTIGQRLNYNIVGDSLLTLSGIFKQDSIVVQFKKKKRADYLLSSRKFNWVQEYPYNR